MELDAIEKDFSEVEGIVKGYLSGTSRSSADDQMKRLREEITKQEEELMSVEQEIERTVVEYEKQLSQNLKNNKQAPGPDQGTKATSPSELSDQERESTSRSECFRETLMSREPTQKQDFLAQTHCHRPRSPEMFIRRLQLFCFVLQSQYRLCPLQWISNSSFNNQLQRHLQFQSKV